MKQSSYSDAVSLENAVNLFQIGLAFLQLFIYDHIAYGGTKFVDCSAPGEKNTMILQIQNFLAIMT